MVFTVFRFLFFHIFSDYLFPIGWELHLRVLLVQCFPSDIRLTPFLISLKPRRATCVFTIVAAATEMGGVAGEREGREALGDRRGETRETGWVGNKEANE